MGSIKTSGHRDTTIKGNEWAWTWYQNSRWVIWWDQNTRSVWPTTKAQRFAKCWDWVEISKSMSSIGWECDDADAKKRLTYEALEHAKLALDLDDKNYASHKVSNTADSMSILESLCKETTLVTINWCLFWEFCSSFFEHEVTDSEVNLKQDYGYYLASLMLWNHMLLTPDLS